MMIPHKKYGKNSAWFSNNVHVLHLQGTDTEMAAAHGALLKDVIQRGPIPYLGQKNDKLVEHAHLFRGRPFLAKLAKGLIHWAIERPIGAHIPRQYCEVAHAIARHADLPISTVLKSLVQADSLSVIMTTFMGKHFVRQLSKALHADLIRGFPGCTSVVAKKQATDSGELLHARNMDYPSVGTWDETPTVLYFDPKNGSSEQRYIAVVSAGLHTPGVTSINESGISLSAHFHCSQASNPIGTPVQIIGSEMIKKAKTIGQAIDIAKNFERSASWSFVLSSAKENKAVVVEVVHDDFHVYEREDEFITHTNHFNTPELHEREILISLSVTEDFFYRKSRARQLLEGQTGKINEKKIAAILADHFDIDTQKIRSQGNTISVITTVTSFISQPGKGLFWIANRGAAPVSLGDYVQLKIDEDFSNFGNEEFPLMKWNAADSATIRGTAKEDAFLEFRKAYISFHNKFEIAETEKHLEKAVALDPSEAHFFIALGHMQMRLGKTDLAVSSFKKALEESRPLSNHMRLVTQLYLGQAYDISGARDKAIEIYTNIIEKTEDLALKKEAQRCKRKPFNAHRISNFAFELQYCDSFEYP